MTRRVWLLDAASAALVVAIGVATNQVLNDGQWAWWWLAGDLVLAGVAAVVTHRIAVARGEGDAPVLWPALAGPDGKPKSLDQVTPRDLGVHASRFATDGWAAPYIPREIDGVLAAALTGGGRRLLVVRGPRLAGTTAALAHAVLTHLPGRYRMVAYHDDPRLPISRMIERAARHADDGGGAVLWLEGLPEHRVNELAATSPQDLPPRLWLAVTLADGPALRQVVADFLDRYAVQAELRAITPGERGALVAADAYADLRPLLAEGHDVLMGRLMVSWEEIRDALNRDGEQATDRVALLRAVADWYRLRLDTRRPLTGDILDHLFQGYRREIAGLPPGAPVPVTGYRSALKWAMATGSRRPRLIQRKSSGSGRFYSPHPLLTAIADETSDPARWPVHDALWDYADRYFEGDQRRDIGYLAVEREAYPAACRLLDHSDTGTGLDAAILCRLSFRLKETGEIDQARRWFVRTIETEHDHYAPEAMYELGLMEKQHGNFDEARHWYREAIADGHPEHAPRAKGSLGLLEKQQGDLDQARHWFGEAIATGHRDHAPWAMVHLALMLMEQAEFDAARLWSHEAIATGHRDHAPNALVNLGWLEEQQGDLGEARRRYREAIATGHADEAPAAMRNLAALERKDGQLEEARHWYREAVATGHAEEAPKAMINLALLANAQEDIGEARRWYREAVATGHAEEAPVAMRTLGWLAERWNDLEQARRWFRRTIATGHAEEAPKAMRNLGALEADRGDPEQARHWYRKAIAGGHPVEAPLTMYNLALLEERQGNLDQARHWFGEAIATGHPEARELAEQRLRDLGRQEEELRRATHYAEYGYLAYADPSMMRPSAPDPEEPLPEAESPPP
ncbi:tetratricopeptide repeat protein [Nonomuraea sp. KM90]|uniref:tetratricopeptide repeat protein n=1 Tax=Nonomuraea sp. KM90 TaxID=3457428 RepID=UPI003FCDF96C